MSGHEESLLTGIRRLELVRDDLIPALLGLADWLSTKDASLLFNRWVFAERGRGGSGDAADDPVIPSTMKCKSDLQHSVQCKHACSRQQAGEVLDEWLGRAAILRRKLRRFEQDNQNTAFTVIQTEQQDVAASTEGQRANDTIQLTVRTDDDQKQRYSYSLSVTRYAKLREAYRVCSLGGLTDEPSQQFLIRLLSMILRYEVLLVHSACEGLQGTVLPEAFKVLESDFGVTAELYASPVNATIPAFCSMFPETDLHFGSLGDVMQFEPLQGSFEVNPPFLGCCVREFASHCTRLLKASEDQCKALCFIVFLNRELVDTLTKDPETRKFLRAEVTVPKGKHHFACPASAGATLGLNWNGGLFRATFDTVVVWLQTTKANLVWSPTEPRRQKLVTALMSRGRQATNISQRQARANSSQRQTRGDKPPPTEPQRPMSSRLGKRQANEPEGKPMNGCKRKRGSQEWVLMLRQTTPFSDRNGGGFFRPEQWSLNAHDKQAGLYCDLDRIEKYRGGQYNNFEFQLKWPGSGAEPQVWQQDSNPCNSTRVTVGLPARPAITHAARATMPNRAAPRIRSSAGAVSRETHATDAYYMAVRTIRGVQSGSMQWARSRNGTTRVEDKEFEATAVSRGELHTVGAP